MVKLNISDMHTDMTVLYIKAKNLLTGHLKNIAC